MPRSTHASAILGSMYDAMIEMPVLIVGAGGIGCELVKNMVLAGFKDITLLDLDTIDLSNLNRQFLFRKRDVKQSKAIVAARTVSSFNPSCTIKPIHGNIKEPQFDVSWFKQYRIVLNALDNLDARRHVNKMCAAAGVPLIESGTAGYLGQVQPIIKDVTECFDCVPKPTPKSFPVCTIRSTPSAPIHCIVWAKSYLFPELFGEQDEDLSELDAAVEAGEDTTEIESLRKEALAFRKLRASMMSSTSSSSPAAEIFDKVFRVDILRLLSMQDMWRFRRAPTPLNRQTILDGTFEHSMGSELRANDQSVNPQSGALKDQRTLSLRDNVLLFESSVQRLASRARLGATLMFDKDDEDALDFVTSASNLRAFAYNIESLTRWNVKEIAGNIIPAIATTNAVIAGVIVLQALQVLRSSYSHPGQSSGRAERTRSIYLQSGRPSVPLGAIFVSPPNPRCTVCRDTFVHVRCDSSRLTLGALLEAVMAAEATVTGEKRDISIYEGGRVLSDPEWDDNLGRTLDEMGCGKGKFVSFVDEAEVLENLTVVISDLPLEHPKEAIPYILPANLAPPQRRAPPPPPPSPPSSPVKQISTPIKNRPGKRSAPDDESPLPPSQLSSKRARTADVDAELENDDIVVLEVRQPPKQDPKTNALEVDGLVIIE